VSEITTESVEEVDLVGPEEEIIVTERETLEITEKPDEKEEIIIEQPEEKPIEKVEEKPEESFRTEIELKPEDETTEEIFKESIEIEKKPELEEVKLDITAEHVPQVDEIKFEEAAIFVENEEMANVTEETNHEYGIEEESEIYGSVSDIIDVTDDELDTEGSEAEGFVMEAPDDFSDYESEEEKLEEAIEIVGENLETGEEYVIEYPEEIEETLEDQYDIPEEEAIGVLIEEEFKIMENKPEVVDISLSKEKPEIEVLTVIKPEEVQPSEDIDKLTGTSDETVISIPISDTKTSKTAEISTTGLTEDVASEIDKLHPKDAELKQVAGDVMLQGIDVIIEDQRETEAIIPGIKGTCLLVDINI
jgi:hypothetical protein